MKMRYLITGLALLAITIVTACNKAADVGGGTTTINIASMQFEPNTIHVPAGTMVIWNNNDNMTHTVTSTDGIFMSGNIPAGSSYSRKFFKKGTYDYICSIHPNMTGVVVVY